MPTHKSVLGALIFLTLFLGTSVAYFGLTSSGSIPFFEYEDNSIDDGSSNDVMGMTTSEVCDLLHLRHKQRRMCKTGKGVAKTLYRASRLALLECQYQFRAERWNCTLDEPFKKNILKKGFKETSFLYAMSSAGLVHEFARACSSGRLDKCTCDESQHLKNEEAWKWGGCGDNVRFGLRFTRRFLRKARMRGRDHREHINKHNSRLGVKMVKKNVRKTCKCHGVSGSCTVKTCWLQLSPFYKIGAILKRKYERSKLVQVNINTSNAIKRTEISNEIRRFRSGPLRENRNNMVHLDYSPSFCHRSAYSYGTVGRTCDKNSNCDVICCGRGYNVQTKVFNRSCACQVVWCCDFHCQQCRVEEEVHLCK